MIALTDNRRDQWKRSLQARNEVSSSSSYSYSIKVH